MLITHFQGLGLDIVISDIPFSLSFQLKLLPQIPKFQWTSNPLILPSFYCSSFLPCPCILLPVLDSMEYHNLSLVLLSLQLGQNSNYRSTAIPFCSLPVPKLLKVAGKKTHNHSDYYHFKFMTTNFKSTSVWHCHLLQKWKVVVGQSCQTLCDPMDCSPPGSSVHEISQARILEWVAVSFSGGSSRPKDQTSISCIGRQILYHWATRAALPYSYRYL